ncbi:DUF1727 domain-containing protein [Candidatus Saccharibacteria bacterium]|nr:DUF1727 domain-containing protein [Candidatus Saccharibacteria bacterium]
MKLASTILGKSTFTALRLLGRTGSAFPGLVVEKADSKYLADMLQQLPQGVIIVSGTNGKTTTTKLIVALLRAQGLRVLTNPTGSNFVRGIISAVVDKASWVGELAYDIAVFEQDEAHAVHFTRHVSPKGVVVLNIMRDQMDRFGEIDTTKRMLQKLVDAASSWVVLNANDERVGSLKVSTGVFRAWFGHDSGLQKLFLTDDQLYHGESVAFFEAHTPDVLLSRFTEKNITFHSNGSLQHYSYALQGSHNALNAAAAFTVLRQVIPDYDPEKAATAFAAVRPAFGRGEVVLLPNGQEVTLQLIKNPGGFTQALRMLELKPYDTVGIAINDDYPDGRDVSWLWDVSFSAIKTPVLCGGDRAADMANRLKYDEVGTAGVCSDLVAFVSEFNQLTNKNGGAAILYCTYTAMRRIRRLYLGTKSGLDEENI